jgi:hypothetical protein
MIGRYVVFPPGVLVRNATPPESSGVSCARACALANSRTAQQVRSLAVRHWVHVQNEKLADIAANLAAFFR